MKYVLQIILGGTLGAVTESVAGLHWQFWIILAAAFGLMINTIFIWSE